eukprot:TRINITY_DN2845_c0_g3_i2.p4 TRINITY_DN2845_c0_g3~~TRINITY_DN2845_c0_g3_i2.p4  ORF type:complete len:209 (-),score=-5.23 TRINITY_DN2845_c0_g3_i2:458-1084(-)
MTGIHQLRVQTGWKTGLDVTYLANYNFRLLQDPEIRFQRMTFSGLLLIGDTPLKLSNTRRRYMILDLRLQDSESRRMVISLQTKVYDCARDCLLLFCSIVTCTLIFCQFGRPQITFIHVHVYLIACFIYVLMYINSPLEAFVMYKAIDGCIFQLPFYLFLNFFRSVQGYGNTCRRLCFINQRRDQYSYLQQVLFVTYMMCQVSQAYAL